MKKRLAICIPTYNRADCLNFTLNTIKRQGEDVQVCISDNASTDRTEELCRQYQGIDIKYGRNKTNLGFDENLRLAILLSDAEWCWTMGDDDMILPGGIKTLLDDIGRLDEKTNAIYVNCDCTDSRKATEFRFNEQRTLQIDEAPKLSLTRGFCTMCIRTETARNAIRNMALSPEKMRFWQQNRLFMDCVQRTGRISIEPKPLMRALAAANDTPEYVPQRMEDVMAEEPLYLQYELTRLEEYGWFPYVQDSTISLARGELRRNIFACKNAKLKPIKDACTPMFRYICHKRHADLYIILLDLATLFMPAMIVVYDLKRRFVHQRKKPLDLMSCPCGKEHNKEKR